MQLMVADDLAELSRSGADIVVAVIREWPAATLLVATGETPLGMYRELAERRRRGDLETSQVRVCQLDAYLGLGPADPRSLYRWMRESFLLPLDIADERVVRLPGDGDDPAGACRAYDAAVAAVGGIDLAILGLGPNGHLGFNEPPAAADAPTRLIDLTEASIVSNARYWGGRERVPRRAITAGMATILAARRTLLLVAGEHKRGILRQVLEGPITPQVPASLLRRASEVTVLADRAAWPERREGGAVGA